MAVKIYNSLPVAPKGYFVEYEQSADETGLEGPTLCYSGPFNTYKDAQNEADAGTAKGAVTHNLG